MRRRVLILVLLLLFGGGAAAVAFLPWPAGWRTDRSFAFLPPEVVELFEKTEQLFAERPPRRLDSDAGYKPYDIPLPLELRGDMPVLPLVDAWTEGDGDSDYDSATGWHQPPSSSFTRRGSSRRRSSGGDDGLGHGGSGGGGYGGGGGGGGGGSFARTAALTDTPSDSCTAEPCPPTDDSTCTADPCPPEIPPSCTEDPCPPIAGDPCLDVAYALANPSCAEEPTDDATPPGPPVSVAVTEPAPLALLALAGIALYLARRKRRA